jgi:hypothetical protein
LLSGKKQLGITVSPISNSETLSPLLITVAQNSEPTGVYEMFF